jgi:hypothetical protein
MASDLDAGHLGLLGEGGVDLIGDDPILVEIPCLERLGLGVALTVACAHNLPGSPHQLLIKSYIRFIEDGSTGTIPWIHHRSR